MEKTLTKAVTHREFLKICGLAIVGAGAGQLVLPPKPASALQTINDDLYVSGKLGVGTATPGQKLDVLGNVRVEGSAGTNEGYLLFRKNGVYANAWGSRISMSDYGDGMGLKFETSDGADTWGTRMTIRHNGKVGIGTTSPSENLEVSGSVEPKVRVTHTGMNGNPYLLMGMNLGNNAALFQTSAGKDFKFHNGQYALTVLGSNGNVGVGTNSPVSALNIDRTAYSGAIQPVVSISGAFQDTTSGRSIDYYINNTTYPAARVANVTDNSGCQGILAFHTTSNFNNTSATEKMRIMGNGNVGIGTNTPDVLLHLASAGAIKIGTQKIADNGGCYYA